MKKNKSMIYMLPLIEGWSAMADYPINCYVPQGVEEPAIIVQYGLQQIRHHDGMEFYVGSGENESAFVIYPVKKCYHNDFYLLLAGKYSKISEQAKSLILARVSSVFYEKIEDILYKNKNLRVKLEQKLDIKNLDALTDEYESKFNNDEFYARKDA